jgi:transcriptional regulator GlxA family with amidase domain
MRALDPRPLDVNQERIEYVVRRLRMSGGRDRIAELCEATNLGQRRLERLFKERVGLTPKYFARVMRLRRAFELLYTSPAGYSLENVLDFGYYDQAHFIHDFQHFAGEAPRAFLGRPQYLNACFD